MKKLTFPLLLATALVAAGCSSDENVAEIDDSQRSAIELSGANSVSRAGFTGANTTLKLHYVSTKGNTSETLYMTSSATANVNTDKSEAAVSEVSQTTGADGQKRYWDDIHAKESKLSLYAIAIPDKDGVSLNNANKTAFNAWDTKQKKGVSGTVANTIAWEVSTSQTLDKIADEDLAYSNNVSGENTLGFNTTSKTFEKAEGDKKLVFNHALSRFTINIKKGDGFGDFANSFNVSSVKFTGFDVKGTLDVAAGTITPATETTAVETVGSQAVLKDAESNQIGYTYVAQVFPGTTIKDVETPMLTITVDGNTYPITGAKIYEALEANNSGIASAIEAGKNYNLTINLKKTAIEITSAQLVDWEEISGAEMTPSNAIALDATMEQNGGDASKVVASDLYRSTEPTKGYTADGNKNTLSAENVLGSSWYWPDNNTKYYFRTISPQNTPVATSDPNTVTMTGGAIADGNDYIWGAPLEEKHGSATEHKFTYNNGYGDYLYSAIGPTESEIHLTQFHMMSNLQVNLTTSDGADKVDLSGATVEILGAYNTATLALSNAAITTTGDKVDKTMTPNAAHTEHTWRVIPQTTSGITLKITAADNVFTVKLPAQTGIESWLPGKSYVYSFHLLKTAIKITSAQLVKWEEVKATGQTITLE